MNMREKLLKLLNKKEYISGQILAKKLNVSRTAIWKQINYLKKLGYKIDSVKNKGYFLVSKPDKPIPEEIHPFLKTKITGRELHYFEKVKSTNNISKEFIKKDCKDGTIIVSDIQTHGRGRKNRKWVSNKGGLWFSIILYPDIQPEHGMILTMACSIAVVESLKKIVGLDPVIKWPNDVLVNNKKICGILTEFDAETDVINNAILGIGLNVNNEIDLSLKDIATSVKKEIGSKSSNVDLLRNILNYFDRYYLEIKNYRFENIREKWLKYSNIIGRKIIVNQNENSIRGTVKDINKNGFLIIDNGKEMIRILSGDIEYL